MLTLNKYPKNKNKFLKLLKLTEQILKVCENLKLTPVLDGSLAIFVYTKNVDLAIKDIDFLLSEKHYPKLQKALKKIGIKAEIKEWHVLQAKKDGLKVEFGDIDHWYSSLQVPFGYTTLKIFDQTMKIVNLDYLIAMYKKALEERKGDPKQAEKYKDLARKHKLLLNFSENQTGTEVR